MARPIVREGLWLAASQASSGIAGLVGLKLLTTLLPLDAYGGFALLMALVAFGSGLWPGPILQATLRFYPEALKDGRVAPFRSLAARLLLAGTLVVAAGITIGGAVWNAVGSRPVASASLLLAAAYLLADTLRSFEAGLLNAARRQAAFSVRTIADAFVKPGAAVLSIAAFGPSAAVALGGFVAGSALVSVALWRQTIRGAPPGRAAPGDTWVGARRAPFLRYAIPLLPLAVLAWVRSLGDRYVLEWAAGAEAVGLYAAAYTLASQPFIAANAVIHSTLRPALYDAVARADVPRERRILWAWLVLVIGVSGVGVLAYALFSPWLAGLLLGPHFEEAASLAPWIALAYALQNVQQTFEIMMFAHAQMFRIVALQAAAGVVALALFLTLIPRYGAQGAAFATLLSFVATCAVSFFLAQAPRRLGRLAQR